MCAVGSSIPLPRHPSTNLRPERLDRLLAPLAAHRAAEPFGLPHAEARGRHRDVEHLILEDDHAERLPERLAERLVLDRVDEVGVDAEPLAALDVGVDGLALDRPRADERDLDGQVVEVLGAGSQEALHLGAALDLEEPDGVGALDLAVDLGIVERDPREIDRLAVEARDQLDGLLDGGEHPEAEQVDLEEAGVGARVLVPLADLAAGHRGGLHRHEVDQRPRRDHHPARVLGEVARQPGDLVGQLAEGLPARAGVGAGHVLELGGDTGCLPAVGDAGEPLELGEREPERLADVADRAAAAVGREGRDERGVLAAVALGDGDDQLLADVPREVEVDVGHRDELVVEEAPEREVRLDRVDVGEAGEVADDRADARAPPPPRRQDVARRVASAHLERAGAGQLEHLPVEQEEPGEAEPGDQRKLGLEAVVGALLVPVGVGVPVGERALAEVAQLAVGRVGPVGEVGVAVAELLGQVEGAAVGDLARPGGGVGWKPFGGLLRGEEHRFVVAAPLALGAVERRPVADGDEDVLETAAAWMVSVDVAGRDGRDAERGRKLGQGAVPAGIAALVWPLELDVERTGERACERRRAVRVGDGETVAGAAGEADEPLGVLGDDLGARPGREQVALPPFGPCAGVRVGQDPAEVLVAAAGLAQERHDDCARPRERDLGARDRAQPEMLGGVGELE